ncbi:MAG: response regulator [Elusimicrobia bacterium]|nr:response regulator [Elusimicrobiota bacterium]
MDQNNGAPLHRISVLLVEDDRDMRYACERFLRKNYDVTAVQSCGEALVALQKESFELIVLDLKMPGMSPEDLFRWIGEHCRDSAVVLMTGSLSDEKRLDFVKLGAEAYLEKPFEMAQLEGAIQRSLKLRRETTGIQPFLGLRVLIAEDDVLQLQLLRIFLETRGCQVTSAADGKEALEALFQEKPDLIFLDIMMPGMNGFEVCQHVRKDPNLKDVPIILVTGKREEIGDGAIGKAPVNAVLYKPVDLLKLIELVRSLGVIHG